MTVCPGWSALPSCRLLTEVAGSCRYVAWVTAAFGPFWGFQEGWWSWLSGVTDNSVYPVLFLTYLDAVVPGAITALQFSWRLSFPGYKWQG